MKHSFKESYGVLQRHAQTLREQTEPNIDDLLQIVEESVAAYKNCQTRIDAVEKALEKALGDAHVQTNVHVNANANAKPATPTAPKNTTPAPSTDDFDDDKDIPF